MCIESQHDLDRLAAIGRLVASTLQLLRHQIAPGISTNRLDQIAARFLRRHGARSAPRLTYGFPGATCISINDEAAHGVPGPRRLERGDLVKLDVSAERHGYFADAAITVGVPPVAPSAARLLACARLARDLAIQAAVPGRPLHAIGAAAAAAARSCGYRVIPDLPGHGVGRALHEAPTVPQHFDAGATAPLIHGLVLTVEPHVTAGSGQLLESRDGWTLRTRDRTWVAVFEHTIVLTGGGPRLLTAA